MKRLVLMLMPAFICGAMFSGCSDKEPEKEPPEEKTEGGLYVIGSKVGNVTAGDKTNLVFTDDDIELYNTSNGEIIFADEKLNEIMNLVNLHTVLHFFIDDKLVFEPPIRIYHGWDLSYEDFDLQFRTDGSRVFLTDAYMCLDSLNMAEIEIIRQKRKAELDLLIDYLNEKGKTVNRDEDMPGYTKSSLCDILFFGDSINVVNWAINGLKITGVYPAGTDLRSIVPIILISDKASVDPPSRMEMDFSNEIEITYTVTAENGNVKIYSAQAVE